MAKLRAPHWLVEQVPRLVALLKGVLREPYQDTLARLKADKTKEDAKTEELRDILAAKTALVESKETNTQLRKDITALGRLSAKVEPEIAPVPR